MATNGNTKAKDISHYLHLYLGCKLKCTNEKCNSDYEYFGMTISNSPLLLDKHSNGNWKLILRPLSSMTEEEMRDLHRLRFESPFQGGYEGLKLWAKVFTSTDFSNKLIAFKPDEFKYLLSKHFDLFGLHESGFCIYQSELKT